MSGECFYSLEKYLSDYCVVLITYDAHDDSGQLFVSFDNEVQKIEIFLIERTLEDFHIVLGTSIGAIMALKLAQRNVIIVNNLFVDGLKAFVPLTKKIDEFFMNLMFDGLILLSKSIFHKVIFTKRIYSSDWEMNIQKCAAFMDSLSKKKLLHDFMNFEVMKNISIPITFMYGGKEHTLKGNIKQIKKVYPDASVIIKERYGHLKYLDEHPKEYAACLIKA